jgi:beta-fructofuranosidase
MTSVFYASADGWVGDVIPVRHDGRFWLFYLYETRSGTGMPWALVSTEDFVHFDDHGVVLPSGGDDAPDFNVYTGSVVLDGATTHLFYTGHNPHRLGPDGQPLQVVLHATGDQELIKWRKDPELIITPPDGYEGADWRDPFVFRASADEPYRMLISARRHTGPDRRRGVIAQFTSTDLVHWEPAEPFWDPGRYLALECPDVFRIGDWWYLVYSEFSESFTTRYRMARGLDGPWLVPDSDTVDGRAYYAAKTVGDGDRRYFCGWIATKEGEADDGAYQWAGTMSIMEARQRPDGTLAFGFPPELSRTFDVSTPTTLAEPRRLSAPDGLAVAVDDADLPGTVRVTATFEWQEPITECGLLLRTDAAGEQGYQLRLEPRRNRIVFDRWPRRHTGDAQWQISGDVPYAIELERPCPLPPGEHTVELIMEESVLVAVIDDAVVLSARQYDHRAGRLGVFAGEGAVDVSDVTIRTRPAES